MINIVTNTNYPTLDTQTAQWVVLSWFESKAGQNILFMVALWNRADHYIFALSFVLLSFSLPNLSCRRLDSRRRMQIGCLPYFHAWCGLSANLECRSEMCCTQLAGNAGPEKSPKVRHLGTIAQLCLAISSQLRHLSSIAKNC